LINRLGLFLKLIFLQNVLFIFVLVLEILNQMLIIQNLEIIIFIFIFYAIQIIGI